MCIVPLALYLDTLVALVGCADQTGTYHGDFYLEVASQSESILEGLATAAGTTKLC